MAAKVAGEVEKNFVFLRQGHWSIPAIWRRVDMVPKPNGKLRLVIDRLAGFDVWVWDGAGFVPLSPNQNTDKAELPEFRWTNLQLPIG